MARSCRRLNNFRLHQDKPPKLRVIHDYTRCRKLLEAIEHDDQKEKVDALGDNLNASKVTVTRGEFSTGDLISNNKEGKDKKCPVTARVYLLSLFLSTGRCP